MYIKEKEIISGYISKHKSTHEKPIILLMISNEEKAEWHYVPVKSLSTSLHRKTSKHKSNIHCLNCLNSFRTENLMKKYVSIKICAITMPTEKKNNIRI